VVTLAKYGQQKRYTVNKVVIHNTAQTEVTSKASSNTILLVKVVHLSKQNLNPMLNPDGKYF